MTKMTGTVLSRLPVLLACAAACGLMAGVPAAAQTPPLIVSTGVAQGTYASMFKDLGEVCATQVGSPLVGKASSGATESLERLLHNEVSAAFMQTDVLHARATTDDLGRVRALVGLHPEPVHILALTEPRIEGGMFGIGGREVVIRNLGDLARRRVGAWGGGIVTARLIAAQSEVDLQVREYTGPEDALAALRARQIDALVAVGGAPLAWLRGLDRSVRLVAVHEPWASRLRHVYRPARLTYANLGAEGVPTVATEAVLAVRDVRTGPAVTALLRLRQCLQGHLGELSDTTGRHSAWSQIDPAAVPHWPVFDPKAAPTKVTAAK